MGTKQFSNYSDLLTFTRASAGHALRPVSYGTEQSPNATFTGNIDGWRALNANATATAENNELKVVTTDISGAVLNSSITLEIGKIYTVSATSTSATVNHMMRLGSTSATSSDILSGTQSSVPTTFRHTFVAASDVLWIYLRNVGAGTVTWDNISVKEVLFDQPDGTLTLFEHPNNIPRVEWDADRNRLGLLVEEARTNLFTNSNAIDSTLTSVQNLTVSNEEVSTGVYQGTWRKLTENTSTAQHRLVGSNVVTISAGSYATISCLVKRISGTRNVQMMIYSGGDNFVGSFDLDAETGSVSKGGTGTAGTATVENLGNGIYRISANGIVSTTVTNCSVIWRLADGATNSYTGDGTSSVAVTAMQIEVGAFRTSLIKTTGATATRSADVSTIPVADFGFNTGAGTFVAEFDFKDPNNDDANYVIAGTTTARIFYNNASQDAWQTYDGTAGVSFGLLDNTGASRFKAAVGVKTGKDVATALDGNIEGSSTSATSLMENLAGVTLYVGGGSTQSLNGHIKSIQYYPRRLTNAQLQDITT